MAHLACLLLLLSCRVLRLTYKLTNHSTNRLTDPPTIQQTELKNKTDRFTDNKYLRIMLKVKKTEKTHYKKKNCTHKRPTRKGNRQSCMHKTSIHRDEGVGEATYKLVNTLTKQTNLATNKHRQKEQTVY